MASRRDQIAIVMWGLEKYQVQDFLAFQFQQGLEVTPRMEALSS